MTDLEKGTRTKLQYTQEARHRVFCALNWDARADKVTMGEKLQSIKGLNTDTYDLDLACVMYDENKNVIDGVSGRADETVDNSGHVYHSGDDFDGLGDDDDEVISVELKDMPEDIFHIVFVVETQSDHALQDVPGVEISLGDAMTNERHMKIPLNGPDAVGKDAYIFARIFRHNDTWMLHYIDEYLVGGDVEDWIEELRKHLSF